MKTCSLCQIPKPKSSFNKNKTKRDGYQTICKLCSRAKSARYYQRNRENHIKLVATRKRLIVAENKKRVLEYLRDNPCKDCGEDDPIVLEFDHLRDKLVDVSVAVYQGWPWWRIEKEIDKCEIACANCHKRRTRFRRAGTYC